MHEKTIYEKLQKAYTPEVLTIENESHLHGGAATESHFKVILVSEAFQGLSRVVRHRQVFQLLSEQLNSGVHALGLHLLTPNEWQHKQENVPQSPKCRGGSQ